MKCEWCKISFGVVIVISLILGVSYQFLDPAAPKNIKIATGTKEGSYYKFAQEYKKILKEDKFNLEIIPTAGSIEALAKLENKEVDLAFIQGGTANKDDINNLTSLASIYFEPIWIFYNSSLDITYINELQGKKIAIGVDGSGTQPLAIEILKQNNINAQNSIFVKLPMNEAKEALESQKIDALFTVISPTSSKILSLIENENIKLLNIKRASAYSKRFHYITPLSIGEGVINLEKNIPSHELSLISTTATLVSQKNLHPDLIRLILKTAKKVHSQPSIFEENILFPNKDYTQIPLHVDAKHYLEKGDSFLEKIFPFWIASSIDRLIIMIIPLLTLLFPLFKGVMPIYRWRIRSKIYKWYKILHEADSKLERLNKEELLNIQKDLHKMFDNMEKDSDVPLSYMGEYYDLKVHANLILGKIEKLLNNINI